jgi:hypothetical protein
LVALLALGGVGWILFRLLDARNAQRRRTMIALACLLAGAAGHFFCLVPSRHIVAGFSGARYAFLPLQLVLIAVAALALATVLGRLSDRGRRVVELVSLALVLLIVPIRYGFPAPAEVTRGLRARAGGLAREISDANANLIIGQYWRVFPALFLVNLERYERGNREQVLAITAKAEATRSIWKHRLNRDPRYALVMHDEQMGRFLMRHFRIPPLEQVARTHRILIMRNAPKGVPGWLEKSERKIALAPRLGAPDDRAMK